MLTRNEELELSQRWTKDRDAAAADRMVTSHLRRLNGPNSSLNAPVHIDGESEWQDGLEDDSETQEQRISNDQELIRRRQLLAGAMKGLSERERMILAERRLQETPATLENHSQSIGLSRERVRQIEVQAYEKLQKSIKNGAIEQNIAH